MLSKVEQQKIFNKVAKHLLTQKKKSIRRFRFENKYHQLCAYRGTKGLKCAIGCLIPNKDYNPRMDEGSFSGLVVGYPNTIYEYFLSKGFKDNDFWFLDDLQKIHDGNHPNQWKRLLKELAWYRNLNSKILEKY